MTTTLQPAGHFSSQLSSASAVPGTILQRWTGASIASNTNGNADGRFYVGVKVTGPTNGLWHYEYAVHNRDNRRGLGGFRVPVCPEARVQSIGFRDIDQDPLDDWLGSKVGGEIRWTTNGNPLQWNSIFNFWFDCDAAPVTGASLALDQFAIGPGALTVAVSGAAPLGLYGQDLGPGCGSPVVPRLFAVGTPPRGTLGLGGGCTLYSASWAGLLGPLPGRGQRQRCWHDAAAGPQRSYVRGPRPRLPGREHRGPRQLPRRLRPQQRAPGAHRLADPRLPVRRRAPGCSVWPAARIGPRGLACFAQNRASPPPRKGTSCDVVTFR